MTGTVWSVKNLFELKIGQRIRVHGNLMENCWKQSQVGYAVLFTPRNQGGTAPWTYVRDVEFTGNLVRHAGSGVQIEGYDSDAPSQLTMRLTSPTTSSTTSLRPAGAAAGDGSRSAMDRATSRSITTP